MLKILPVAVLLLICFQAHMVCASTLHTPYDKLLKKHVIDGQVDYKNFKNDYKILAKYLEDMSKIPGETFYAWSQPDRLAYLINVYNAATLQLILRYYPAESIKNIGSIFQSPWKRKYVRIFGKIINLDILKNDIIRKNFKEPRIHLALTYASQGGPPLRAEAYIGSKLHEQFEEQGRVYFSSPHGLQVDKVNKKILLTNLLKVYRDDFLSVASFAQKYRQDRFDDYEVDWLDYDWNLDDLN